MNCVLSRTRVSLTKILGLVGLVRGGLIESRAEFVAPVHYTEWCTGVIIIIIPYYYDDNIIITHVLRHSSSIM